MGFTIKESTKLCWSGMVQTAFFSDPKGLERQLAAQAAWRNHENEATLTPPLSDA
ncbi:MAG: hypothetical protein ABIT38_16070 [Gemmatimonadaceae bacterium]